MAQTSKIRRRPLWAKRVQAGLALRAGSAPVAVVLAAVLLAGCIAALSTGAAAAESHDYVSQSGKIYILNLDQASHLRPVDAEPAVDVRPNFGAAPSPSGVLLPDVSRYFELDGNYGQGSYFTPRVQGFQLNWSGDQELSSGTGAAGGDGDRSQTYMIRPKSVGANFSQKFRDFEISLGGDYGRTPKSVPGAVRLVEDHKLLRLGAHARTREFTVGGSIGSDINPYNLGETLSWDAFSRYDFGEFSIGLVYNYTIEIDDPSQDSDGMPGTLQGGVSYAFTPRMAITTNVAYGSDVSADSSEDTGIVGVLGFSLDF